MTIAFYSNYINHHQVPVADELYRLTNGNYYFVETIPMPECFKAGGYPDLSSRPYVIQAWKNEKDLEFANKLCVEADVVIIGSAPEEYVTERIMSGKITFRYTERWFKKKHWCFSGPKAWIHFFKNHIRYKNKPLYMLAASAYTPNDVYAIGAYKNKCYKWGYFTKVDEDFEVETSKQDVSTSESTPLMWCARL